MSNPIFNFQSELCSVALGVCVDITNGITVNISDLTIHEVGEKEWYEMVDGGWTKGQVYCPVDKQVYLWAALDEARTSYGRFMKEHIKNRKRKTI